VVVSPARDTVARWYPLRNPEEIPKWYPLNQNEPIVWTCASIVMRDRTEEGREPRRAAILADLPGDCLSTSAG
jgi:hypothetical protein